MTIRTTNTLPVVLGPRAGAGGPGRRRARAATTLAERKPTPSADVHDIAALSWDLTIHELYRVFADCLEPLFDSRAGGESRIADVRLAATRHALRDIDAALRRVEAGTYGVCDHCGRPIARQRLRTAPTTVWCATCPVPADALRQ